VSSSLEETETIESAGKYELAIVDDLIMSFVNVASRRKAHVVRACTRNGSTDSSSASPVRYVAGYCRLLRCVFVELSYGESFPIEKRRKKEKWSLPKKAQCPIH